ncbi:MAG: GNAT family N-acetyltransferase [Phycisphaerae bacterium]|nr:GNAT family N-acetyltransferase [Phycisphaerae bacterium]
MDETDVFGSLGLGRMNLSDKALFDHAFATTHPQLSDYTFANTYIWRDAIHLRRQIFHGCLCVFANGQDGLSLLFPPLGEGNFQSALAEAVAICREFNARMGVEQTPRVEYVSQSLLAKFTDESIVKPMSGDYIYSTRRMIDLDGPDLGAKRKGRSWFLRHHNPYTTPLRPDDVPACLALLERWTHQAEESTEPDDPEQTGIRNKRTKETAATRDALANYQALGLSGMLLWSGEELVGFTLGERLHDEQTCSILIEKTNREFRGSANYIFSEFCRQYWADTAWCNAGDDWDMPSLAWTKQSYQPAARLNKWVVWPKVPARFLSVPSIPTPEVSREVSDTILDTGRLEDLPDLLRLESYCFPADETFNRRQMRYLLRCPRVTTYLVRAEGQVAAAAIVARRRTSRGIHARLYSMAVAPSHRRRGFGRMLMKQCVSSLLEEGVGTLSLEVRRDNTPAVTLYESMGFQKLHPLPEYYGPGADGWRMGLKLTGSLPEGEIVKPAIPSTEAELCEPSERRSV